MLSKVNYRPTNSLPYSCISKIFENLLIDQLRMYFNNILSQYLSGYRSGYGCEDVLLHFDSLCKKSLDDGDVGIVGLALLTNS